jgi:hypothetical protein
MGLAGVALARQWHGGDINFFRSLLHISQFNYFSIISFFIHDYSVRTQLRKLAQHPAKICVKRQFLGEVRFEWFYIGSTPAERVVY